MPTTPVASVRGDQSQQMMLDILLSFQSKQQPPNLDGHSRGASSQPHSQYQQPPDYAFVRCLLPRPCCHSGSMTSIITPMVNLRAAPSLSRPLRCRGDPEMTYMDRYFLQRQSADVAAATIFG